MSKDTISLRQILDFSEFDIGLNTYPIYDFKNVDLTKVIPFGYNFRGKPITTFRDYLNNIIVNHYYFREIGQDTPMRFKIYLNRKMAEIMPYYNQMFESIDIQFNPLWNVDLTETFTHAVQDSGTNNSEGSSRVTEDLEQRSLIDESSTNNNTRTPNIQSDTITAGLSPAQNGLTNDEIKAHQFLKDATHNLNNETGTETNNTSSSNTGDNKVTNDNEVNTTNTLNNTNSNTRSETYTRKQEGSSAGYLFTQNIEQWRKIMLNIPLLIVDELKDLFYEIYE